MTKKNIENLCRICVKESHSYRHIYDQYILDIRLYEVINDLCQLDVSEGDGFPAFVCADCHGKLVEFQKFKRTSHEGKAALLSIKMKCDEAIGDAGGTNSGLLCDGMPLDIPRVGDWSSGQITDESFEQLLEVNIKEEPEDSANQEGDGSSEAEGGDQFNQPDAVEVKGFEESGTADDETGMDGLGSHVFIKSEPIDANYGDETLEPSLVTGCGADTGDKQVLLKSETLSFNEGEGMESSLAPGYEAGSFSPQVVEVTGNGVYFSPLSCMRAKLQQIIGTSSEGPVQLKQEEVEEEGSLRRSEFANDSSLSCSSRFTADEAGSSCDGFSSSSQITINGLSAGRRRRSRRLRNWNLRRFDEDIGPMETASELDDEDSRTGMDDGTDQTALCEQKREFAGVERKAKSVGKSGIAEMENERYLRLRRMREYEIQRRAVETQVEREKRLGKMRAYFARKLAKENRETRQERLLKYKLYQARRLMSETDEQRELRLLKCKVYRERYMNSKDGQGISGNKTRSVKSRHYSVTVKMEGEDAVGSRGASCMFPSTDGIATLPRERASKTKACKAIRLSCENKRLSGVETYSSSDSDEGWSARRKEKRVRRERQTHGRQAVMLNKESDSEKSWSLEEGEPLTARPNTRANTKSVREIREDTSLITGAGGQCNNTRGNKSPTCAETELALDSNAKVRDKQSKRNQKGLRSHKRVGFKSTGGTALGEGSDKTECAPNDVDTVNRNETASEFGTDDVGDQYTNSVCLGLPKEQDSRMPLDHGCDSREVTEMAVLRHSNEFNSEFLPVNGNGQSAVQFENIDVGTEKNLTEQVGTETIPVLLKGNVANLTAEQLGATEVGANLNLSEQVNTENVPIILEGNVTNPLTEEFENTEATADLNVSERILTEPGTRILLGDEQKIAI